MSDEEMLEAYRLARMLAWQQELGDLTDEATRELVSLLLQVQRELRKQIKEQMTSVGGVSEWTADMERDVSMWLRNTLAGTVQETTAVITESAVTVAIASVLTYNSILSVEGIAKNVRLFEGLTAEQIQQFFEAQPLGGKLLQEWVEESFTHKIQDAILSAIREGVLAGEGIKAIADRVLRSVDVGFIRSRRDIEMLVRTYVQSANVGAQEAVYKQNEDVIKGYRRKETLDNRTCKACALNDGMEYAKGEPKPDLPAHPGCRGMWLPITKSFRELGLDMDEFKPIARHWAIREDGVIGSGGKKLLEYGKVNGNFGDWFKTLSPENKAKTSIGTVRIKLLGAGSVTWRDLVDKRTGRVKTLEELGFDRKGMPII